MKHQNDWSTTDLHPPIDAPQLGVKKTVKRTSIYVRGTPAGSAK